MKPPTQQDIESAYQHGIWLISQECTGEGRMLADLAFAMRSAREAEDSDNYAEYRDYQQERAKGIERGGINL